MNFIISQIWRRDVLRLSLSVLLLAACGAGCGLIFGGDQRVDNKSHDYTVHRLDRDSKKGWRVISPSTKENEAGDVAFEHEKSGSIISMNSVCKEYRDTSLEELSRHLLLGLNTQSPPESREVEVDGVPALESTVDASMTQRRSTGDNERYPVKIRAVVLQKNQCTYDLMYIARPEHFEAFSPEFERFLKGFHVE